MSEQGLQEALASLRKAREEYENSPEHLEFLEQRKTNPWWPYPDEATAKARAEHFANGWEQLVVERFKKEDNG